MKVLLLFLFFTVATACQVSKDGSCPNQGLPIGGYCEDKTECILDPHVLCEDNACQCESGWIEHDNLLSCLEILDNEADLCEFHKQCRAGKLGALSSCTGSPLACACNPTNIVVPGPGEGACLPVRTALNETCKGNEQCDGIGDFVICAPDAQGGDSICFCDPANSIPTGGRCVKVVNVIGERCETKDQCTLGKPGDLSDCLPNDEGKNVCTCIDDTIGDDNKCYEVVDKIGDTCEVSAQCKVKLGEFSECLEDKCECPPDSSVEGSAGTCLEKLPIDGPCEDVVQCPQNSDCSPTEGCKCQNVFIPSQDNQRCLALATLIGDECEDPRQCVEGSPGIYSACAVDSDRVRKCFCTPEGVANNANEVCLLKATEIGEPCTEPQQCQEGALGEHSGCFEDDTSPGDFICNCTDNAFGLENFCYHIADKIGDACIISEQCTPNLGEYSDCLEDKCECVPGAVPDGGGQCVLKDALISQPCLFPDQCVVANSTCNNGTCTCDPTLVGSNDLLRCIPIAEKLGAPCEAGEHQQCTAGKPGAYSECFDNACRCLATAVGVSDICYLLADSLDDSCEVEEQCQDLEGSHCLQDKCGCNGTTHVPSTGGKKCLAFVDELNGPCEEPLQCRGDNVVCDSSLKRCLCETGDFVGSEVNPGSCVKKVTELFANCTESVQCTAGIGEGTRCHEDICQCDVTHGFIRDRCHERRTLGESCAISEECIVGVNDRAYCSAENVCKCFAGSLEVENSCWEDKRVGDDCTRDKECTVAILGESYCDTQLAKCDCKPGTAPELGGKLCSSAVSLVAKMGVLASFLVISMFFK